MASKKSRAGTRDVYKPSWEWFDSLAFLERSLVKKPTGESLVSAGNGWNFQIPWPFLILISIKFISSIADAIDYTGQPCLSRIWISYASYISPNCSIWTTCVSHTSPNHSATQSLSHASALYTLSGWQHFISGSNSGQQETATEGWVCPVSGASSSDNTANSREECCRCSSTSFTPSAAYGSFWPVWCQCCWYTEGTEWSAAATATYVKNRWTYLQFHINDTILIKPPTHLRPNKLIWLLV